MWKIAATFLSTDFSWRLLFLSPDKRFVLLHRAPQHAGMKY